MQHAYLAVRTQERLLSEVFSFSVISNKVADVPCHSGAVLLDLVYCREGRWHRHRFCTNLMLCLLQVPIQ
jgi:hypothetical protein